MAQILVNNSIALSKGEISVIADDARGWTHNETLKQWLIKFPNTPISEYHRNFALIKVTDKSQSELSYLTEPLMVNGNPVSLKWYFVEPDETSIEWKELFTKGEISKTFNELLPHLRERT